MKTRISLSIRRTPHSYAPPVIPSTYFLDLFPGAAYAYSYRKLSPYYGGSCLRIRRSTDNTELDIGFNGDYVDESAITTFIGANYGYVVKWYDQSGNGVDKVQTTAGEQPISVNAGTLEKEGAFVGHHTSSVSRDGGLYNVISGGGATSQCFNVMSIHISEECLPATNTHSAATRFYGVMQPNGSSPTASSGSPTYYKNGSVFTTPTRQTLYDACNGQFIVLTSKDVDLSAWTESSSMYPSYRGIRGHCMEEIVYFDTTQDRALIEANIIDYYGL